MPSNSGFDLPIDEVKSYINELMGQIGEAITVDDVPTMAMLSDSKTRDTVIKQYLKEAVFSFGTAVKKGSKVVLNNGTVGIVYNLPTNDLVSESAEILLCNSKPNVYVYGKVYDTDKNSPTYGDVISNGLTLKTQVDGFIERLTAKEHQYDVGLLHDAILRFTTFEGTGIALEDILVYKDIQYRVIDIDYVTDGVVVIQLASVLQ